MSSPTRRALTEAGLLRERATGFVPVRADDYPAARVALRSASADSFVLIDASSGEVLGTIEAARAYSTVHDGAIYLHLGRSYVVRELDLDCPASAADPFSGELLHADQEREHDLHRSAARSGARRTG